MKNPNSFTLLFLILSNFTLASVFAQNGNITYTLHRESNPTQDQQDAYSRIKTAMDSAIGYYNRYTGITKHLNVYYNTGVPTAQANFDGTISFGQSRSYMVVITAMHEMAHTVGAGTTTEYRNLIQNGVFTGQNATEMLREITGDHTGQLKGDNQHFWPYGLNYASEVSSQQDLINHCRIVDAIYKDLFHEEFFRECRLRSISEGTCMTVADGNTLRLGNCSDPASLIRMIALNGENVFRLEFGNQVLDIPNESKDAGIIAGLYNWNGGAHQRVVFEFQTSAGDTLARIKLSHSGLYLRAGEDRVIQDLETSSQESLYWELLDDRVNSVSRNESVKRTGDLFTITGERLTLNKDVSGNSPLTLRVTDLQGRTVRSVSGGVQNISINTSTFAGGVYLVHVSSKGYAAGKIFKTIGFSETRDYRQE